MNDGIIKYFNIESCKENNIKLDLKLYLISKIVFLFIH